MHRRALLPALLALASSPALAQSNVTPGLDIALGNLGSIAERARTGTYPTGATAFGISTTSCNLGTVLIPFLAPMQDEHPFIHFLVARQDEDRLMQISDRSFIKHAFASANQNNCGTCQPTDGTALGIDCADTYGTTTNSNRFWLAPAEEVDPWLGTWNPVGSYFDGVPVDGLRDYFGSEPSEMTNRVIVRDEEMDHPTASFYYAGGYVVRGESEALRDNNIGWREFTASWVVSNWILTTLGSTTPDHGSVLEAWNGATLDSTTNGSDDGRVFVAAKTTMVGELHHYEYAIHNRDNVRGIDRLRIPISPGTVVSGFGFHDVDQDASNDWSLSVVGNELVIETPDNPLLWNTIFNVWFDADTAPANATLALRAHFGGAGAPELTLGGPAPLAAGAGELCLGDGGVQPGCTDCPCGNDAPAGTIGGCLNEAGTSARILRTGTASVGADSLVVSVQGGNPQTFGVLASGDNALPVAGPCPVGSGVQSPSVMDGLRCIGGNFQRHGARGFNASGANVFPWGPGLVSGAGFSVGQTRSFQIFYRANVGAGCGTGQNTTNAFTVTVEP